MRTTWLLLATVATAIGLGCGGPDPEVQLAEASAAVEQAKGSVETALAVVKKREVEVQEAQARLDEAREALRQAQEKVAKSEAEVNRSATDAVLFRTVQKRLLTDEELRDVAISATVRNGNVTLTGTVPNARQRDHAVELAKSTPGVGQVESQIVVPVPAAKKAD